MTGVVVLLSPWMALQSMQVIDSNSCWRMVLGLLLLLGEAVLLLLFD